MKKNVLYYNNKFNKIEHFFSNIKNVEKDTTSQMELFFDAIMEFKIYCEKMELNSNDAMKQLYLEHESEKILKMFENWDKQIYLFEYNDSKLFSPSLIICLNYIYDKNILNDNLDLKGVPWGLVNYFWKEELQNSDKNNKRR